jgi:CDP-diacylglycerol--glycerol-3-phosphate 3-phosphatidyltransferase
VLGVRVYHGGLSRPRLARESLPNAVTLFRGTVLVALSAFLVVEPSTAWLPAALYALVTLLDAVDGLVARRLDAVSDLGATLDAEYDAVGLAVGPLVAATLGGGPLWFAALGLVRVPFLAHLALRRRQRRPVGELPPSRLRRPLAAAAMVVTVLLLSPAVGPGVGRWLATAVAVPFMLRYAADWLALVRRPVGTGSPCDLLPRTGGET